MLEHILYLFFPYHAETVSFERFCGAAAAGPTDWLGWDSFGAAGVRAGQGTPADIAVGDKPAEDKQPGQNSVWGTGAVGAVAANAGAGTEAVPDTAVDIAAGVADVAADIEVVDIARDTVVPAADMAVRTEVVPGTETVDTAAGIAAVAGDRGCPSVVPAGKPAHPRA